MIERLVYEAKRPGLIFWLQILVLLVACSSVEAANWVESVPLPIVGSMGVIFAYAIFRWSESLRAHLWVLPLGVLIAYSGGIYLCDADQLIPRFEEANSRLIEWWRDVTGEDVTTDTLPLSMILIGVTWVVSYITSWFLFKFLAVWSSLVPLGSGTLINLTYLPKEYYIYFFAFLFVGLLLLVQVTSMKRKSRYTDLGVTYPQSSHWFNLTHGVIVSGIAILVMTMIPVSNTPPTPLKIAISPMNNSLESIRGELHRIFAVVPGHHLASMRFFGSVLPLIRPVPVGNDPIFSSDSDHRLYWPATKYDQYTSTAWKFEQTEMRPIFEAEDIEGEEDITVGASSIFYKIQMLVGSPYLLVSGNPYSLPYGAEKLVPLSPVFDVDLSFSTANTSYIPRDIRDWIESLKESLANGKTLSSYDVPSTLQIVRVTKLSKDGKRLSQDVEAKSYTYQGDLAEALNSEGSLVALSIIRAPDKKSVIAYKPKQTLKINNTYEVAAFFDFPSESAMRNSSRNYPPKIKDRYLQLPATLPDRVRAITRSLTNNSLGAYDKAVEVETYLRNLKYTPVSKPLSHNVDVVDHFLFESQEGYGDYFASAMAVMLRTIDIPTRLVLGFGPGIAEENGGFLIRDKDSHAWPEVYFTNIGWVPFEPTPIYERRTRGMPSSFYDISYFGLGGENPEDMEPDMGLEGMQDSPEMERNDLGGPLPGGEGPRPPALRHFGTPLGMGGLSFGLCLIVISILMMVIWKKQYGDVDSAVNAFEKMKHLSNFLGIASPLSQTPFEFSNKLTLMLPPVEEDINIITDSFIAEFYGNKSPSAIETIRVQTAWNKVRRVLISQNPVDANPT